MIGKARGTKMGFSLLTEQMQTIDIDFAKPVLLGYSGLSDEMLRQFMQASRSFFSPLLICLLSDWQTDHLFSWSGYAVGGLCLGYLGFGLPLWFQKPNPVIFVPCDFVAIGVYLLYICLVTRGNWFFPFGLPLLSGLALITCTVVTLLHYVGKGKLYIWGGAFIAMGGWMLLLESLLFPAFAIPFAGWSIYPLIVFVLLGGTVIYLAINRSARETMERKLFF